MTIRIRNKSLDRLVERIAAGIARLDNIVEKRKRVGGQPLRDSIVLLEHRLAVVGYRLRKAKR